MTDPHDDDATRSRFVVGIDLGTTNSAMCYVDTDRAPWSVETFGVIQWVDTGEWESRETLPSFHYELTPEETRGVSWRLPWQNRDQAAIVGIFARDAGQRHPGRRIASAKSWLSHDGIDRGAKFLPWHGDAAATPLSPVEASAAYLSHLRDAWNAAHVDDPLEQQDVVITLPASFDEVARELTIQAAKRAGLMRIHLIEEPQAAFYAWIHANADRWHDRISAGQMILVCDIGGGTTDFSLIRVQPAGDGHELGSVQFHRVAVGNHLILGGDNLDLAIARLAEQKLVDTYGLSSLEPDQWDRLRGAARAAKETMLGQSPPPTYTLNLPSSGAGLIGGSMQVSLTAADFEQTIVEGFFPVVALDDRPNAGTSGFREFGLPYASDAAITRHLAAFLRTHRRSGLKDDDQSSDDSPAWVLFNGGVMAAPVLRDRIVQCLSKWFGDDANPGWLPEVLSSPRLDLAVAQGAAYYAMVRRGEGVRIAANLGRSYYLQIDDAPVRALCVIPGNAQAGQRFSATRHPLRLNVGQPVQFPMWVSSTRLSDLADDIVVLGSGDATALPPIRTALRTGRTSDAVEIDAAIECELSEIGTIEMSCVDTQSRKRWKLEFDIRSTLETDREAHLASGESRGIVDSELLDECDAAIRRVFDGQATDKPARLIATLQDITEMKREAWPPTLLRGLWQRLMAVSEGRRRSASHESRWLNLIGYCLRPGYGVAVDDWRVDQTWKSIYQKIAHPGVQSRIDSLVLWRRIGGGLNAGRQRQLVDSLFQALRNPGRIESEEQSERWRLAASLERISSSDKTALGRLAMEEYGRKRSQAIVSSLRWAIGRLGNRTPLYGPLNEIVNPVEATRWIDFLTGSDANDRTSMLALVQMARQSGDRHRDVSDAAASRVIEHLKSIDAPDHFIQCVLGQASFTDEDQAAVFGESLPLGIRLASVND